MYKLAQNAAEKLLKDMLRSLSVKNFLVSFHIILPVHLNNWYSSDYKTDRSDTDEHGHRNKYTSSNVRLIVRSS